MACACGHSSASHFWNAGSAADADVAAQAAMQAAPKTTAANLLNRPITSWSLFCQPQDLARGGLHAAHCNDSPSPGVNKMPKKRRRYGVADAGAARNRLP